MKEKSACQIQPMYDRDLRVIYVQSGHK